jgi:hypothetical protein
MINNNWRFAELADKAPYRMNRIRNNPPAWVSASRGKIHTRRTTDTNQSAFSLLPDDRIQDK